MYKEIQAISEVAKFMKAFNQPVLTEPTIPSKERCDLRVDLIQEELDELKTAIKDKDIIQVADALGDLQYVLIGAVHEFGLGSRFSSIFTNIHLSNMSKICNSYEEAADTLKAYKSQGIEVHSEKLEGDTYIIKRTSDNKVLKNKYYVPATLNTVIKTTPTDKITPPFLIRLMEERDDVSNKVKDLTKFINIGMPHADTFNKALLPIQLRSMQTYLTILNERINSFTNE